MPEGTGFAQMASVPIAGLTALQALLTHGKLKAGESVLINGSSGGVGHFAVQIAKAYRATVTAVCSGKNVDFAKSLGADHVIAYDKENIHRHEGKYNLILDTHGNLSHRDYQRMGGARGCGRFHHDAAHDFFKRNGKNQKVSADPIHRRSQHRRFREIGIFDWKWKNQSSPGEDVCL
jgi:NADPH:quinone reductase-like Zn-dependent oxidoreductase